VADEVLADAVHRGPAPAGAGITTGTVELGAGPVRIAVRRIGGGAS
jgi:hypothetical protein